MKQRFYRRIAAALISALLVLYSTIPALASEPTPGTAETVGLESSAQEIAFGPGYDFLPDSEETEKAEPEDFEETGEQGEYLGEFTASGYCSCSKCSGGHNRTYSGTVPKSKHTIAADINTYPIGTKLMIDGVVYTVEDIGSGVKGNRLDIFFDTHEEALNFGLKKVKVYSVK